MNRLETKLAKLTNDQRRLRIIQSPNPRKRFRLILEDGRYVDFGQPGAITYYDGAPEQKRKAYMARHSKIFLKDGTRAIDEPFSPAWLSWYLLWN